MSSTGKSRRLARLSGHGDGRYLFVPLDHSVSDGPIAGVERFDELVRDVVAGGADGIVVHKGRARVIDPELLRDCSLIVHLSASTAHAPDVDAKVLVGDVEDAIRLGADAVSVHVNIGSRTEAAQLADLGAVAAACDRWNMPLLAMVYPRGPRVTDPSDPVLLSHVVNIAADLGVDIVKTVFASPAERMAEVVDSSPLPIIVAGGDLDGSIADFAASALAVGCRGLAVGRRVFGSATPRATVLELAGIVHDSAGSLLDRPSPSHPSPRMAGAL
ncbi:2-amino-3,7-dideoxy-D-threo-hept-6-ulosonate synthase [Streptomyces sp. RB6PN25]|uniref:2-amino-3,7-dideoxy-D-threo-hept-6-ulosonate synthase n=1 Tax=Streptomyces humicola TaxID=2953240 RepID=A0ABT1Q2Z1_9ACTN|nr:2-amino-3,7-dideoxy-D-threo-hept-6-ulosonate synthase [Streptomyces humicola]MCQ4084297.1 2-amino-3,7-dideoxy-D-threo-hept-6-ulosonate synthase [Streptomyces humicola]